MFLRKILIFQKNVNVIKRKCSTSLVTTAELNEKRNCLFSQEQRRQIEEVGRVEKMTVEVAGLTEDTVLIMNKGLSTPYDCCRHISEALTKRCPLAVINDKILWDMHRPLPGDCSIKFLSFKDEDPFSLNEAFWRTGSFLLGRLITNTVREDREVKLFSLPPSDVRTGSFIYDCKMSDPAWYPTIDQLRILSGEFLKFAYGNHKIERLSVKKSVAMDIFDGNEFKQKQAIEMAAKNDDHLVTLYRVDDYIDISNGPMVGDTSFFGRCSVTAVHYIDEFNFYRFQAVALPKGIMLNSTAYDILVKRGMLKNEIPYPNVGGGFYDFNPSQLRVSQMPITSRFFINI